MAELGTKTRENYIYNDMFKNTDFQCSLVGNEFTKYGQCVVSHIRWYVDV